MINRSRNLQLFDNYLGFSDCKTKTEVRSPSAAPGRLSAKRYTFALPC